ncbi:MAG: GNAT family N-acetyltransferase [Bdellovibrio sp.]|nr:GNAT family N-acetyltransferase [Bdellovibrio sp.]
MQGPRSPEAHEFSNVVDFLDHNLRQKNSWTITSEYPTALSTNNIHNMSIITEDEKVVSHAVLKPIIVKTPFCIFKLGAIGSVVTDPDHRNQGLSTKNIENCIEMAKKQDCDMVILWTSQFDFYRKFGFELAGYEETYVLETARPIKNKNLRIVNDNKVDPAAILKLYSQHTVNSVRTIDDIRNFLKIPNSNLYTAWNEHNQLIAYAAEGKGADLANYVHEWAGNVNDLMDVFSFMQAKNNLPLTVMVPTHSTNLRLKLQEVCSSSHQGYLGMIKIINDDSLFTKVKKAFRAEGLEHIVLEKHPDHIVFGYGPDLYTIKNETDLVQLLFGPLQTKHLDFMKTETQEKLATLLPLPLWIWGWDSI